jgi:predicted nucleic acid-binding protein
MSDLYDTCLFIDYWRGDANAKSLIDFAISNPLSTSYSPLSVMELWQNPMLGRQEEIEYTALTRYFLKEAPLSANAAMKAGQWLRKHSRHARMILSADAVIAATAEEAGETIRTRNCVDLLRFYRNVKSY